MVLCFLHTHVASLSSAIVNMRLDPSQGMLLNFPHVVVSKVFPPRSPLANVPMSSATAQMHTALPFLHFPLPLETLSPLLLHHTWCFAYLFRWISSSEMFRLKGCSSFYFLILNNHLRVTGHVSYALTLLLN